MTQTSEATKIDIAIIGGGAIGCAMAAALAQSPRFKSQHIALLEAAPRLGEGITSRNSGVIHGGLYYPPTSLKAQTCIVGNRLLYEWCTQHEVPHKKLGKLIVAQNERQLPLLEALYQNAKASGVPRLKLLTQVEVQKLEPSLSVHAALHSPETGIIDQYAFTKSLMDFAEQKGVMLLLNSQVNTIDELRPHHYRVHSTRGSFKTSNIINAAGLYADDIAAMVETRKYRVYPCRGDYFAFTKPLPFQHLIYPVKDPQSPGLGIHLTIDMGGRYKLGPDAEYVDSKTNFSAAPHKKARFQEAAFKLFGEIANIDLQYDTCGLRPKLRGPQETEEKDFVIAEDKPGFINLVGIESPGLTASLALAKKVCEFL